MENQILDNQGHAQGINVTFAAQQALRTSANWGIFLAIMGFIGIGFMALAGIGMVVASFVGNLPGGPEISSIGFIAIFYLILAAIYFFPVFYLWKFCQTTKQALISQSSDQLEIALVNQAKMYKWSGIMVIAVIGLYIVFIIGMVLFGVSGAGAGIF